MEETLGTPTPEPTTKNCNECKLDKPFSEFYKVKGGIFGLQGKCRRCHIKYVNVKKDTSKKRGLVLTGNVLDQPERIITFQPDLATAAPK